MAAADPSSPAPGEPEEPDPAPLRGPGPLTAAERWRTAAAALVPIPIVAVGLLPFAIMTSSSAGEVLGAAVVYGGLLGLASGFVYVDRLHARQCPRCRTRNPQDAGVCAGCAYDLTARPRYACDQGHRVYVEPGLCDCGRRLQRLEVARGVRREVVFMLKVGAWLLAFLVGVGVLLQWVGNAG